MKKIILTTIVCLGALIGTAPAQTVSTIKVTLPYAASVGGVNLPAGEYTIRDLHDTGALAWLQISTSDGKSVVVVAMEVVAPKGQQVSNDARVELKLTDIGYQIRTVWLAGREIGYQLVEAM